MAMLPPDHSERLVLAHEVHARPPEPLDTPTRATYVAVLIDASQREREFQHLLALCATFGIATPAPDATHFSANLGPLRLKWERHGEFSGYTFFARGASPQPFSQPAIQQLPPGWLGAIPGSTVVAAHAELLTASTEAASPQALAQHFQPHIVVGSEVGGGAGLACTDFCVHPDGFSRFLLIDHGFTPRQAGRMLQRLFEIEAYRMMALLALPIARRQWPTLSAVERSLAELTANIAAEGGEDEALLHALTRLAAEVESGLASSQFRFGACRAYFELVTTRITELREQRVPGMQTIEEFMTRRLTPAVQTCATVSQRLHDLSERVAQASSLLSTRVDIARERQNQALLGSMDRRAKLQLRLQQTVEGLSVAAIVYYVSGLVSYVSKALKSGGLKIEPDLIVGLAIPAIAVAVLLAVRREKRHIHEAEHQAQY